MLGGIVAMQVSLLRLNTGISRAVQTQSTLERQNMSAAERRSRELTSGERVAAAAARRTMIDPPAGETRYLTARPATDPRRAVRRMKPPSERAIAIMDNGGMRARRARGRPGRRPPRSPRSSTAQPVRARPVAAAPTRHAATPAGRDARRDRRDARPTAAPTATAAATAVARPR